MNKRILITGIAGFIGMHLARLLKDRGNVVIGCDDFNDYYDVSLKKERATLLKQNGIEVFDGDISTPHYLHSLLKKNRITHLIHLAAQAGVRYSIVHPEKYQETNLNGFFHVLESIRHHPETKLIFASSSSVYGLNKKIPFSETDPTEQPANFYGATKKANELMAHAYHKVYGLSIIGLRFFTVYGPWGRPDMAYFSFTKAIMDHTPIKLFNHGQMKRDFTYIDDIIAGTASTLDLEAKFEIFNLGNHQPEEVTKMISIIESFLGKKAIIELLPMPVGEIPTTYADIAKAQKMLSFHPKTSLEKGMEQFLEWYSAKYATFVSK